MDYTKNFTKYCSSKEQAIRIASKVAELNGDKLDRWTVIRNGRYIKGAEGKLKNFKWSYSGLYKQISVWFTDDRPQVENEPKETYYIIWIEGFNHKTGDKIKYFSASGIVYTHSMTEAMRVRPKDLERVKDKLRYEGIASWVIDSPKTYVETHYAPKGTLFA